MISDAAMVILPDAASDHLRAMAKAAELAGQGLLAAFARLERLSITEKTQGDFVSDADLQAEQAISQRLMASYPDYGWLGEETGARAGGTDGWRWIVDPLDGTTNFLKGVPHWAVSIALYHNDTPICGIVFDPVKRETFSAERGKGAQLNGRAMRVSRDVEMSAALLASGVPAGGRTTYLPHCLADLEQLMPATSGLRRMGAAALDLAYVAAGRFDAYWERNLGAWDIAAGRLLVEEAGGMFTPLWPDSDVLDTGSFIASNGALHAAIADALTPGRVPAP